MGGGVGGGGGSKQCSWIHCELLMSYFCSRGNNSRISVRVILLTRLKLHQRHC